MFEWLRGRFPTWLGPAGGEQGTLNARILLGMVWVVFFVLLAKLAGAAKEVAVAATYGVGPVVDAYSLLFNSVMWPVGVAVTVLTTLLIPLEAQLRAQDPAAVTQFRRELMSAMLVVALLTGGLLAWALPRMVSASAGDAVQSLAQDMVSSMALTGGLAMLAALYSVWIMAGGSYANTMIEGLPALALLLTLLLVKDASADWLVRGTLAGVALQLLVLIALQGRQGRLVRPTWRFTSPAWRGLIGGLSISLLGQVLMSSTAVVETFIAAGLGEGAVATLGYANRLLGLFSGIVLLAVTRAMLPVLSQAAATGSGAAPAVALHWLKRMAMVGLVLGVLLWFLAEPLTRALFERGQFTSRDTDQVAHALRFAALQLPLFLPSLVLTSYAAAVRRLDVIFYSALISVVVRPTAGWILGAAHGVPGLTLAQALAYGLSLVYLAAWFSRQGRPIPT